MDANAKPLKPTAAMPGKYGRHDNPASGLERATGFR